MYNDVFILFRDVLFKDHEAWTSSLCIHFARKINANGVSHGQNQRVGNGSLFEGKLFRGAISRINGIFCCPNLEIVTAR